MLHPARQTFCSSRCQAGAFRTLALVRYTSSMPAQLEGVLKILNIK